MKLRIDKQYERNSEHIHHLRKLRNGKLNRYECMDCGKRLRILSGVLVASNLAEAEAYLQRKRERQIAEAKGQQQ